MRRKSLRVAVLTMLDSSAPGHGPARAFLRVGGLSVARQQVSLALQLGCERVVCIAPGLSPELIALQHLVEAAGAQFNLIGQARALVGLISAVDEVVVLADGLFVSAAPAAALLDEGQAVLVQPIEQGLAAGFERIDLNHAFGGAMRLPGRLVERMAELPSDCDAVSALLRIALQAGIRQKPIPTSGQPDLFWTLIRSEDEAHALEPQWIRQRTRGDGVLGLGSAVALFGVRSFGPALLHAGSGSHVLVIAASVLALLAFGAGWFGLVALGLFLAAAGWILRECAVLLSRIEFDGGIARKGLDVKEAYSWAIDAILVMLAAWGSAFHAGAHFTERLFPPFMLVAMLRILPRMVAPRWSAWFSDRALLALLLGGAVLAQVAGATVMLAASILALAAILVPAGQSRLTRP